MKRWLAIGGIAAASLVIVGAAVLGMLAPPAPLLPPAPGAAFENVTLVNPGAGRAPGRRVRVEGGTIASIEATAPDAPAPQGYLLPGLVDMHVHGPDASIAGQEDLHSLLYLAHGVTTVRDTGGGIGRLERGRRIARGELAGPRIFACGLLHDGDPPVWRSSIVVETAEQARVAVAEHAEYGFDCLKVYERLRPEALAALVREARAIDMPVVGHVPVRVRLEEAGIDDVQHLRGVERAEPYEPIFDVVQLLRRRTDDWDALDDERIGEIVRISREQSIAYTPTLVLLDRQARTGDLASLRADPALRLLPRFYPALTWNPEGFPWYDALTPEHWKASQRTATKAARVVAALFRGGVRIHAGTDVGNPFLVPGASLHEELRALVAAGLTPEEAWLTATRWAGEFLRAPGLGVIEVGAPADLLLFREDPTRDLAALSTLDAVVADGRLYSRATLDRALAASERHYHSRLYDAVSMAIGTRRRDAALAQTRSAETGS